MLETMALLIVLNITAYVYTVHVFLFGAKGLKFLKHAESVLLENNDVDEVDKLKADVPVIFDYLLSAKSMLYFIMMTMLVNMLMLSAAIFPVLFATTGWNILMLAAGITNSFVLISFRAYRIMKININATCESYNVLIQSYQYISEYEENDNDSPE
jgi:hypothetical protein